MPIPLNTDTRFEDWETMHRTLGCYGCMYATKEKLGNNPCCTRTGKLSLEVDKDWKCINRKEAPE